MPGTFGSAHTGVKRRTRPGKQKSGHELSRDKYPFISRVGVAYLVYCFCFQVEMKDVALGSNPAT